jgi:hypothetical protein
MDLAIAAMGGGPARELGYKNIENLISFILSL